MKTNLQNDIDKLKNDYINFTKDVEYFIEKSIKEIQENNIINILEETLGIEIGVIPLVKVWSDDNGFVFADTAYCDLTGLLVESGVVEREDIMSVYDEIKEIGSYLKTLSIPISNYINLDMYDVYSDEIIYLCVSNNYDDFIELDEQNMIENLINRNE